MISAVSFGTMPTKKPSGLVRIFTECDGKIFADKIATDRETAEASLATCEDAVKKLAAFFNIDVTGKYRILPAETTTNEAVEIFRKGLS